MTDITDTEAPVRKRGSGAQMVYGILRDEILDLVLAPGSPIEEVQISERLKVSRTPVREALVRLAGEGLVSTLPNRSTVVSQIDFPNLRHFFDALTLMYRVTTRKAAEFHKLADLETIRGHQAAYAAAVENRNALAMISTNRDFHAAIAMAGRNPYYVSLFLRLLDDGRRLLRLYYQSFDDNLPRRYVAEHDEMIKAIAARNVDECDRLATAHADQIVQQIQKLILPGNGETVPL